MITPPVDDLAPRLAKARQQLAERAGSPSWPELTSAERGAALMEASNYLRAAAAAGIAVAAVDLAVDVPTPARATATVRDFDNRPLDRDDYASHLDARAAAGFATNACRCCRARKDKPSLPCSTSSLASTATRISVVWPARWPSGSTTASASDRRALAPGRVLFRRAARLPRPTSRFSGRLSRRGAATLRHAYGQFGRGALDGGDRELGVLVELLAA